MLSLKGLVGDIDHLRGKKLRNISNGIMVTIVVSFVFFIILSYATHNMGIFRLKSTMFWSFVITFSLVSYMFLFSICLLVHVMKKVSEEANFKREKRNIMLQFIFFLLAFATRAIFFTIELYLVEATDFAEITDDSGEE